jgi:hypothetical protein
MAAAGLPIEWCATVGSFYNCNHKDLISFVTEMSIKLEPT